MSVLTLLLFAAGATLAPASTAARHVQDLHVDQEALKNHDKSVHAEHREVYRRAFAEAGSRGRARAAALWREWLRPPLPAHHRPTPPQLTAMTRVLRGHVAYAPGVETLQRSVDGIALLCLPGVIVPPGEGERLAQPVVVNARPAFESESQETALFQLYWMGPEGEQLRARQESVEEGAWETSGLDFYLRAPKEALYGTWRLEPRMKRGNDVVIGPSIPVPVVPTRGFIDAPPFDVLEVERLRVHGLRRPGLPARLTGERPAPPVTPPELAALGLHALRAVNAETEGEREVLILFLTADETPEELQYGAVGNAWREALPPDLGLFLLEDSKAWPEAVAALKNAPGAGFDSVHLVGRESAGFAIASRAGTPEFESVASVVMTTREKKGRRPEPLGSAFGAWVTSLAEVEEERAEPYAERPAWHWVRSPEDPFGLDLSLPRIFLDARSAAGRDGDGR